MKIKPFPRSNLARSFIFILLPLLISLMMYNRIIAVLQKYMEYQVTVQAAVLGELASQKLTGRLDELERIAGYYQDGRVEEASMSSSFERLLANSSRLSCGILKLGGEALYGKRLPAAEYPAVQKAFRGFNNVRYREGEGLLLTVPVYNGGNIKYVLYEFCDEDNLLASLGESCYKGNVQILLVDGSQQKVVSTFENWEMGDSLFPQKDVQTALGELRKKMGTDTSAAVYYNGNGNKGFLFVSEIGQGNLYIMGKIPYSVVAEGVSFLSVSVLLVFSLLLILLCIGTFNMFSASAKARESDALREAKAAAEEANKSKSRFLANMSHELRTPINVILGMNEMILREDTGEVTRERAMDIKGAAQILLGLINDVLDFSKIEEGSLNIIPVEYNLVTMIRDLVLLSENRARQKSLNFEMKIAPDLPVGLYGDDIHIRQVMINLLTNAVKYTEDGTVTLEMTGEKKDGDRLILHCVVSDTGIGIKQEDLKKLFIPFSRVEERRNRNIEGSGLGLSIIINLLRQMGSELHVESVYGEGSVFSFELEQKIVDAEPVGDIQARLDSMLKDYKYQVTFIAPQAHILMVDDNSMNRRLFTDLLKKTKIQITTASSGKKALDLVQQEHFDLIFMDYLMPEMDGEETLRRLNELENSLCKGVPVIALTANAFNGSRELYMKMGFDDFLAKPIMPEKLEELLWKKLPKEYICESPKEDAAERQQAFAQQGMEELPHIDGVNWEYAQLFLKDRQLLLSTLRDFYANIDQTYRELEDLEQGIDTEEGLELYRIYVHALKSNTALVGILSVSELAKLLEYAARDGEREKVHTTAVLLLEEIRRMKERIRPFMEQNAGTASADAKPLAESSKLKSLLEMLRFSMERMDIAGTDACMKRIHSYSYPPELEELVARIDRMAEALDYDGAIKEMESAGLK